MKFSKFQLSHITPFLALGFVMISAFLLAPQTVAKAQEVFASVRAASLPEDPPTTVMRKGSQFQTAVVRKTEGKLASEDFQQVSLLGTRIIQHVNEASDFLVDEQKSKAKAELNKAQTLADVIRKILPVTTVETVVTRSDDGSEVYRHTDRVQDDLLPIFSSRIAVEVMEPILDAKKDMAAVQGVKLADADLIHTSIILDLSYVERKIKRCLSLMEEKPERALAQLVLAQDTGVQLSMDKEDHPLVEAQASLRIAQRMAEEERFEAAKANLSIARNHLEIYRGISKSSDEKVKELDQDIQKAMDDIKDPEVAKRIGKFWDRLTGWFKKDVGVARTTQTESAAKPETK